jgi:hypothetical protein
MPTDPQPDTDGIDRPPAGTPGWCERCDDWIANVGGGSDEDHDREHRDEREWWGGPERGWDPDADGRW